jgi:CDGSH-type Zn-finger protein
MTCNWIPAAGIIAFFAYTVARSASKKPDDAAYSIKSKARVAQKGPYGVAVEAGKTYYFCTCGASKNQPFCDGSHKTYNQENGTQFASVPYVADKSETKYFCGCKQSKTGMFCDGSHAAL